METKAYVSRQDIEAVRSALGALADEELVFNGIRVLVSDKVPPNAILVIDEETLIEMARRWFGGGNEQT